MEQSDSSSPAVFQVTGEPAICINGLPKVSQGEATSIQLYARNDAESYDEPCFGRWLEGREVRKLFGDRYYFGKVVNFDSEMKWYSVVYEDGDSEDLEWHELEEVLLPLDISVPLKTLVLQIYRDDKTVTELEENAVKSRKRHGRNVKPADKIKKPFQLNHVSFPEIQVPVMETVLHARREASKRKWQSQIQMRNLESTVMIREPPRNL